MAPEDTLLEAERILRIARIRHLPIVDGGILVGILSHRDVLEASLPCKESEWWRRNVDHLRKLTVGEVMRIEPWTAKPAASLQEAAERMLRFKIGCLPVVERGKSGPRIVGLLTESDLLRAAYTPAFQGASD